LRWNEVRVKLPPLKAGEKNKRRKLRLGKPENIVSNTEILILAVVIAVVFGVLWWQGQIRSVAVYFQETREELRKCSWPTVEELKGSTALVLVSIGMLGAFTVAVDFIMNLFFIKL
jgi:preprotein translocase subunit SecE